MPNAIKYSTTGDTLSLKKGNIFFGVGDVGKGPSSATTYYNGVSPATSGYTIYSYNVNQTSRLSFFTAVNDASLITYTNGVSGQNFNTATQCLNWYATQTNYVCVNRDYEGITTNGLVLNLDAGFTPSYSTSGITWYDLAYSGNNGTLTNGPTYNSSNGGIIVFDSVDDYVTVPYNSSLDLINTVSLESWVKYSATSNTVLIEKSNNNTHYQFQIFNNTQGTPAIAGQLVFMLQPNENNWVVSGMITNDNNWHHVVGTYDRSTTTARIYVDGVLKNTNPSISTGPTTNTQPLLIGSRSGVAGFGGSISNVRIYNRVLSSTEVLQNYNAQVTRFASSYDADAQAFFTAAGITNTTQKNAVNQLVLDLKSYNLWSSMIAIYPFVGGTANTNKYNLKNTSTYTLSFGGGWTHSSTGSLPNGTNGYADTGINPAIDLGSNHNYSVYSRTDNTSYGNAIGTYELGNGSCGENGFVAELQLYLRNGNVLLVRDQPNGNYGGISNTSTLGYFTINRTSSTLTAYKNGSSIGSFSASLSLPYNTISLSAAHIYDSDCGTTYYDEYDSRELAFVTFANSSLSSTNISNLNTAVQAFQTTLGRQV